MYVVAVTIHVLPGKMGGFMEHMKRQASQSMDLEAGCRQFDVSLSTEEPETVLLYEVYDSRDAFDAHLRSRHFMEFEAAVKSLMASKQISTYDLVEV